MFIVSVVLSPLSELRDIEFQKVFRCKYLEEPNRGVNLITKRNKRSAKVFES